ncbi:Poly(U)-binding-splicing factor puf60 [Irineochytrium annulatum]|nr:Poly(U)-binding-splicing factor puf60 [Irineochytrium annulatum]
MELEGAKGVTDGEPAAVGGGDVGSKELVDVVEATSAADVVEAPVVEKVRKRRAFENAIGETEEPARKRPKEGLVGFGDHYGFLCRFTNTLFVGIQDDTPEVSVSANPEPETNAVNAGPTMALPGDGTVAGRKPDVLPENMLLTPPAFAGAGGMPFSLPRPPNVPPAKLAGMGMLPAKPMVTPASLTSEQREKLALAKQYAKEQTILLLAKKPGQGISPLTPLLPNNSALSGLLQANGSITAAGLPAGLNPLLVMSTETRNIATMSRIYVGSISFDLTDVHIREVFGQFGSIKNVTMTIDPLTKKHKGFCFVEFDCPEAAELAIDAMNGLDLGVRTLKVGRPNNYNAAIAQTITPAPPTRVYVANVNEHVTEEMVRSIFESFGDVVDCVLLPDRVLRKHRGCGYIQFTNETHAKAAIAAMQGGAFELGGLRLRAMHAIVGGPMVEGMKALEGLPPISEIPAMAVPGTLEAFVNRAAAPVAAKGLLGLVPGAGTPAPYAMALQSAVRKVQSQLKEEAASLEDDMSISATQRYSIMQKLMRKNEPNDSPVIRLKNMVTVSEIDPDLNGEISEECSKYGNVVKVVIWVDPNAGAKAMGGGEEDGSVSIFVQFETPEEATKAKEALHGRWFGGRTVEALSHDLVSFKSLTQSAQLRAPA